MTEGAPAEIVAADRRDSFLVRMDGRDQSHVDLADPTRVVFGYLGRMRDVVDTCFPEGQPLRVVHVGGAGLTLPRYVAATRPGSSQVVLEPDADLTELVRRDLPLPPRSGIRVRPVDGRTGLSHLPAGRADAVLVDAFVGGRVPDDVVAAGALADAARALRPGGVLVLNVVDDAPFAWGRRVVAGLAALGPPVVAAAEPATLRGRRAGNLVLASSSALSAAAFRTRVTGDAEPWRVLDAAKVSDTLGGGVPFT
jgi:hypothetical protein